MNKLRSKVKINLVYLCLLVAFSSCKKNYHCHCGDNINSLTNNKDKDKAKIECEEIQKQFGETECSVVNGSIG